MATRLSSITDLPESTNIQETDIFLVSLLLYDTGKYLSRKANLSKFPNASKDANGFMSKEDKTKLESIEAGATKYELPIASNNTLGGIKVGANLTISEDGVLATTTNKYELSVATSTALGGIKIGYQEEKENDFAVKLNVADNAENGKAFVEIPKFTNSKNGLVPKTNNASNDKYLNANGEWTKPTGTPYNVVTQDKDGLCPKLPSESTTTKFLRQDGTWAVPAETKTITFDDIYPVGSIYISVSKDLPGAFDKTKWTRIAVGQCLFGANDDGKYSPDGGKTIKSVGDSVDAGLPTITGTATGLTCATVDSHTHTHGYKLNVKVDSNGSSVYAVHGSTGLLETHTSSDGGHSHNITGTVSIQNSDVYGKATTVQPPALVVSMWQRTK